MHRIDTAGHDGNRFRDEDPQNNIEGTVVDDDWLNAVQEELVTVLEKAGVAPTKGTNDQLFESLIRIVPQQVTNIAALKSLGGGPDGRVVYMKGRTDSGVGGGHFRWSDSDQSNAVSNDPGEGAVVPPDSDASGASGAWLREFEGAVYVSWFGGGPSESASANVSAFNDAVTYSYNQGGGFVVLPAGTYEIDSRVVLNSGVVLVGQGPESTVIKLADGSDSDMLTSEGFDDLTGTNSWQGIPYGLGLMNLRVNGNKANNSTGRGVAFYAKRLNIRNVVIHATAGVGWYSEAGDKPGQWGWSDVPESQIESLWIRNCGNHGMLFRGPHDAVIHFMASNENAQDGLRIERLADTYSGSADVRIAHIYANGNLGCYADIAFRCGLLICENNDNEGFRLDGWMAQLAMLQLYTNCRSLGSGNYQAVISDKASYNHIGDVQIKDNDQDQGGMKVAGNHNTVVDGSIYGIGESGTGSPGTGVELDPNGTGNRINAKVSGFSSAGGKGFYTFGALQNSTVDMIIEDCDTCMHIDGTGRQRNTFRITPRADSGQTAVSLTSGAEPVESEVWEINGHEGGALRLSSETLFTDAVDMTSTSVQTLALPHNLIKAPNLRDVDVNFWTGATAFSLDYVMVTDTTDNDITVKLKLGSAAPSGTGYISAYAEIK